MRILFVCTGNTCRSPMAEGMMRKLARERGFDIEVKSAGVSAAKGMSISHHAGAVLKEQGIEDRILSTPLHAELVNWADLILALTEGHKRQMIMSFPDAADKTYTLKEYAENDPVVLVEREELQRLAAEIETDRALGREPEAAALRRLTELVRRMPVYDISDPFGGSREDYNRTAAEIRSALEKLLERLMQEHFGGKASE
ncbi:low molecular weight protein arginine phosphatase [Paenibacillus sp. M1]|uniref:Low molecular weight protein arginine phosphatase n=1 Tax=Paenibacillus haidiansis TaxID=1574488 RepID=A0ABU7VWQ1_9BACL